MEVLGVVQDTGEGCVRPRTTLKASVAYRLFELPTAKHQLIHIRRPHPSFFWGTKPHIRYIALVTLSHSPPCHIQFLPFRNRPVVPRPDSRLYPLVVSVSRLQVACPRESESETVDNDNVLTFNGSTTNSILPDMYHTHLASCTKGYQFS